MILTTSPLTTSPESTMGISTIEQHLSQQGKFCLIDWLLNNNLLSYSDYEGWRNGKQNSLDSSVPLDKNALQALLDDTHTHCGKLGLTNEAQEYFLWGDNSNTLLRASRTPSINQALTQQWLRPQDVPQMDLFMDNSAVIAENTLHQTLADRQFQKAQLTLQQLTQLNSEHPKLGAYQDLLNYGLHTQEHNQIDPDHVAGEINGLEQEVLPLAKEVLGSGARDYLSYAWRRLANSMQAFHFDSTQPKLHPSYCLMQIPDWAGARERLEQEPDKHQSVDLIQNLALCCERLSDHNTAALLWCLLFDCDQDFAENAIESRVSNLMWPLWETFWEINDGGTTSFFPAFVLANEPGLIHHLPAIAPLTSPSTVAMADILKAHLHGGDEIVHREKLQAISPALLRLYMQVTTVVRSSQTPFSNSHLL
jgi:hypothetical protein